MTETKWMELGLEAHPEAEIILKTNQIKVNNIPTNERTACNTDLQFY